MSTAPLTPTTARGDPENGAFSHSGISGPISPANAFSGDFHGYDRRFPTFVADSDWTALAAKKGLRLPRHAEPATPANIRRWLHKLGLTTKWFTDEFFGYPKLADWQRINPTWGLRALVGLLLEELEP